MNLEEKAFIIADSALLVQKLSDEHMTHVTWAMYGYWLSMNLTRTRTNMKPSNRKSIVPKTASDQFSILQRMKTMLWLYSDNVAVMWKQRPGKAGRACRPMKSKSILGRLRSVSQRIGIYRLPWTRFRMARLGEIIHVMRLETILRKVLAILLRIILRLKARISLRIIMLRGKWRSRRVWFKSRLVVGLRQFWDGPGNGLGLGAFRIDMCVHREWKIEFCQVVATELAIEETFKTFNFSLFTAGFKNIELVQKFDKLLTIFPIFHSFTLRAER